MATYDDCALVLFSFLHITSPDAYSVNVLCFRTVYGMSLSFAIMSPILQFGRCRP